MRAAIEEMKVDMRHDDSMQNRPGAGWNPVVLPLVRLQALERMASATRRRQWKSPRIQRGWIRLSRNR